MQGLAEHKKLLYNIKEKKKIIYSFTLVALLVVSGFMGAFIHMDKTFVLAVGGDTLWSNDNHSGLSNAYQCVGITEVGDYVYFTNKTGNGLIKVSKATGADVDTLSIVKVRSLIRNTAGTYLYFATDDSTSGPGRVTVSSFTTDWQNATPFGSVQPDICFGDSETYVYVAGYADDDVTKLYASNGTENTVNYPVDYDVGGGDSDVRCVACCDGWMFVGGDGADYQVEKFGQDNGTEDTTGWPFTTPTAQAKFIYAQSDGEFIYIGGGVTSGYLYKVNVTTGNAVWSNTSYTGKPVSSIQYDATNDYLYVATLQTTGANLYKYDASDCSEIWSTLVDSNGLYGSHLNSDLDVIYVGSDFGKLYAIDTGTSVSGYPTIDDTAFQNSLTNIGGVYSITFNGSQGETVWSNSSGIGSENMTVSINDGNQSVTWINISLTPVGTSPNIPCDNFYLYASESVDSGYVNISASCGWGAGGGNITVNSGNWTGGGGPFPINGADIVYFRFKLCIPADQTNQTYTETTGCKVYIGG